MKHIKSHFKFTRGQRNGIFLLVLIIILLQCVYLFVEIPTDDISINETELAKFQHEIDSLKLVEVENTKPKIFPFNPNYITDYKGYTLGMSSDEIDRLLEYREQDKWINSTKQFQQVTKVSDSLLAEISPYFKFPEWVTNPTPKPKYNYQNNSIKKFKGNVFITTHDFEFAKSVGDRVIELTPKGAIDRLTSFDSYISDPKVKKLRMDFYS